MIEINNGNIQCSVFVLFLCAALALVNFNALHVILSFLNYRLKPELH